MASSKSFFHTKPADILSTESENKGEIQLVSIAAIEWAKGLIVTGVETFSVRYPNSYTALNTDQIIR